jgi:capsular exopolysaccharide synthesis family protein
MGRRYEAIKRAEKESNNSAKAKQQDIDANNLSGVRADMEIQAVKPYTREIATLARIISEELYKILATLKSKSTKKSFSIVFSSVKGKAGASTISINAAKALCKNSNSKVVLIDGNLHTPALHRYFRIKNTDGWTDLLNRKGATEEVLHREKENGFYFIPAGTKTDNPMTVILSEAFSKFNNGLTEHFDYIIFDSAPILTSPETALLAKMASGLILIVESGVTKWEVAKVAKKQLEDNNVNILGAILNKKKHYIPDFIYNKI